MNRKKVVLSGFSKRLFCFVHTKTMYVWLYVFLGCIPACVDAMMMSSA